MDTVPEWFTGCRLNFAENLLKLRDDKVALIETGEHMRLRRVTYGELYERARLAARALSHLGVRVGDRVSGFISNNVEAIVAMLATSSIGAIWSSTSPDFGVAAVLDRFSQIRPKVLFAVNATLYNGKVHTSLQKLKEISAGIPTIEKIVVIPQVPGHSMDVSEMRGAIGWDQFLGLANDDGSCLRFEQLPFKHPLYIMFSSGTTGKPKCLVHSAGGTLLKQLCEHVLHGNLTRDDVYFYYTTTGWMMWNWLVVGLATGCTLLLFDGSPFKPSPEALWELSERTGVTIFGTSAKYIESLQEGNMKPGLQFDLIRLRTIYSTGSPLSPESFDYVYHSIKRDVLLGSITGGTDILGLFAGMNPMAPVYTGELQKRCLGMKVESWSSEGKPITDGSSSGDLVCTKVFPSMPVFFWNDPGNERYSKAYFSVFKGVWHHGDFVFINPNTGGVVMLGRSDATLNPGGVRFGSADLYNIVNKYPEIQDSLAVGQKRGADERVILFLKMHRAVPFGPDLVTRLKSEIRSQLSPRHVPSMIVEVPDIPYTVNGKKVEVIVKRIISGDDGAAASTISNPECLAYYRHLPELKL